MRHFYLLGLILANLSSTLAALHKSDVGIVDWHQPYVGVPLTSLSTAPTFHKKPGRPPMVLTATRSNVLAALHASNGSLAWRFIFEPDDVIVQYQRHGDVIVSLSGPGGTFLRSMDYSTGQLLLEKRLHPPQPSYRLDPDDFGLGTAVAVMEESPDILALSCGHTVQRIGEDGRVHWAWQPADNTSSVIYAKLVTTRSTVYVVGILKSPSSQTLHVTSLSASTGEPLASVDVPSNITDGSSGILSLSSDTTTLGPRVVWLEAGTIRSLGLVPNLKEKPTSVKGPTYNKIIDIGLHGKGLFVALKTDDTGRILKLDPEKAGPKVIWEFSDSAKSDQFAESFYLGGLDKDGLPYIGRVFWSFMLGKAAAHLYYPPHAESQGFVSSFTFDFNTRTHGIISHVASYTANAKERNLPPFLVLTTTTGAVQLWQGDIVQWTREEGLTMLQMAEMVELPERKSITAHIVHQDEMFIERIRRQLTSAKGLPIYLFRLFKRFTTASLASAHRVPTSTTTASDPLARDAFGFRQVIVAANDLGKIYGLDSSNGVVLWSRVLGLGWAAQVGGQIIPSKLFVVRTVVDGGSPEVVLVTQRWANNGLVDTVVFHVNALTGEDALGKSPAGAILEGIDLISGPLLEVYQLPGSSRTVVIIDEFHQAHIYPETPTSEKAFARVASKLNIASRAGRLEQRQLKGHHFNEVEGGRTTAFWTWQISLPAGEEILSVISRPPGPVASLGKVLGNRTTLYKYLNPNLFAVTTTSPNTCRVYVMDAAKGTIVYHTSIAASKGKGKCDLHATLVENWLVYVYWDEEYQWVGQTKGQRLVSVEFYEGSQPDEKTRSSELSPYSSKSLDITTIERSYVFPHAITSIATTTTKFGVSTKDVIVANANGQIQSFPRLLLNPRRTKDKPTSEDQEEWLLQYDPVLPDDAHRVLSHSYHVANIRRILTSPAYLESTSLVFAYGLDLFFTRVAPSGTFDVLSETFNKVQLVFTICGLAAAILVTRPMVRRKRLREKWYQ